MATDQHPIPFEIVEQDGMRLASNGSVRLALLEADGRLFKRRGISGLSLKAPGETLIPQLNAFAGELLANPAMPAQDAVARLLAIAGTVSTEEPRRKEWAVAELAGVRVYVGGQTVLVTRQDLQP